MPLTIYLEAAARTQAVIDTKWTLRSCGCIIASTWHDKPIRTTGCVPNHWASPQLEDMRSCDALVVVREQEEDVPPKLAFAVGLAIALDLPVIWVGSPIYLPGCNGGVKFFATVDEFRRALLFQNDPRSTPKLLVPSLARGD